MKILKRFLILVTLIIISISCIFIKKGYEMYTVAIQNEPLEEKVMNIREKENYISLDEVPEIYILAVISVEDHRFYNHHGIDIIAISRAFINDVKARSYIEGGSTITQQLAKNIYFTQEKKITRKIAEVFMAFEIEKNYGKSEILELYINTIYYGDGYYTIKEACNRILPQRSKSNE